MQSRTLRNIVGLSLLLSCGGTAWSQTDASSAEQSSATPHTFCVSDRAPNGRVYLTPIFQDPLRDVRDAFAAYLANAYRYRGSVKCFTLRTRELADEFRVQRIAIAHWRNVPHIVVTEWVPQPEVLAPPPEVATREADSGVERSAD